MLGFYVPELRTIKAMQKITAKESLMTGEDFGEAICAFLISFLFFVDG
jgi:hypothetical protein